MQTVLFKEAARGKKDIGWLKSNFIFSFSDFADPTKSAFGTVVAFNDDLIDVGGGFGVHPHQNMEIISIMLQGSMNHKDSMGYTNIVHEDWVQIMSAGSGLFHEEHNIGKDTVNFLQIWIQSKQQNIRPRYQFRFFPKDKRINTLKTIVSAEEGMEHCWINQNTKMSLGLFEAGNKINYSFNPVNKCLFIFVIEGTISIGKIELQKRDAIGIWEAEHSPIECTTQAHFLIIETPVNQK
ncbi:MAG: pirin family protein [Flavisolibacter sp.]